MIGRGADMGQYADWNLSGKQDQAAQALDLDKDGTQSVLHDHDDWSNLILNSRRYQFANNSGAQKPAQRNLLAATASAIGNIVTPVAVAFDPLTQPFQRTVDEALPLSSMLQRLIQMR